MDIQWELQSLAENNHSGTCEERYNQAVEELLEGYRFNMEDVKEDVLKYLKSKNVDER